MSRFLAGVLIGTLFSVAHYQYGLSPSHVAALAVEHGTAFWADIAAR